MAGTQKNIRLSRRALELLRALKYVLDASDNLVIEASLNEAAEQLLVACAQRLRMAEQGAVPEAEARRLRAEAAVLVEALNTEAGRDWPPYRIEGHAILRQEEDGTWRPVGGPRDGTAPGEIPIPPADPRIPGVGMQVASRSSSRVPDIAGKGNAP